MHFLCFQSQADDISEGQQTPPRNPSSKEPTPQPEDIPPSAVGSRTEDGPPSIAEEHAEQAEDLPSNGASREDVTSSASDTASEQPEQATGKPAPEEQSTPEPEATPPPSEDTNSPGPVSSPKELSPVPEEPVASTEASVHQTASSLAGSEAEVEQPASSPDLPPQPAVSDSAVEDSESRKPEEVPPALVTPEQTTAPKAEEVPEESWDQTDGEKRPQISLVLK